MTNQSNTGELWSFLRSVLSQGGDIWLDHQALGYEQYSARLDVAARERVQKLLDLLSGADEPSAEDAADIADSVAALKEAREKGTKPWSEVRAVMDSYTARCDVQNDPRCQSYPDCYCGRNSISVLAR